MSAIVQSAATKFTFYMTDAAGLPVTGLSSFNFRRKKEAEVVFTTVVRTVTGIGFGVYEVTGLAADTDTLGRLTLILNDTTAAANDDVAEYSIQTADESSLSTSIGNVAANVWTVGSRTLTSFGTLVADIWAYGTRTLTAFTGFGTDVASAVWDALRSGYTISGSFGQGAASVQGNVTGSVASVTGNVGGNVVGSVDSVVNDVGGNVNGDLLGSVQLNVNGQVGSVGLNGITSASIAASAASEIGAATWEEFLLSHTTPGTFGDTNQNPPLSAPDTANAVWDELYAGHATVGTFGETNQPGTNPTVQNIVDGVWDELRAIHVVPGSFGFLVSDAGSPGKSNQQVYDSVLALGTSETDWGTAFGIVYDPIGNQSTLTFVLTKNGNYDVTSTQAVLTVLNSAGTSIFGPDTDNAPTNGVFSFVVPGASVAPNQTYVAKAEFTMPGPVVATVARTFTVVGLTT